MEAEEIDSILRIQWRALHSGPPYVEDYYYQVNSTGLSERLLTSHMSMLGWAAVPCNETISQPRNKPGLELCRPQSAQTGHQTTTRARATHAGSRTTMCVRKLAHLPVIHRQARLSLPQAFINKHDAGRNARWSAPERIRELTPPCVVDS